MSPSFVFKRRPKTLQVNTVKLGFKEQLNEEQLGNIEPFPVTNMPVHLINSEKLCDDQKVPYYQFRL